jgi:hypothetical protein
MIVVKTANVNCQSNTGKSNYFSIHLQTRVVKEDSVSHQINVDPFAEARRGEIRYDHGSGSKGDASTTNVNNVMAKRESVQAKMALRGCYE